MILNFLKDKKKEIEKVIGKITKEKSNVEMPTAKEVNFTTGILGVNLDETKLTKDIQQFGTLMCYLPAPKFTGKKNVAINAIEISWGEIPKSAHLVAKLLYEVQLGRKEKENNWKSVWKGKERKCRIANLEYDTKYVARVRAFLDDNTNIVGEWSQLLEIKAGKEPQPINGVVVTSASSEGFACAKERTLQSDNTYWLSAPKAMKDQWLIYDFGEKQVFRKFQLRVSNFDCTVRDFILEEKTDDLSKPWRKIGSFTAQSGEKTTSWQTFEGFYAYTRYVRLFCKNAYSTGDSPHILITEVKFWG